MIRNVWRLIEKSGFAIFMISVVAVAIGWSQGFMPIVYGGLAIVLIAGAIVLIRANRAVSGRPKARPTTTAAGSTTNSASKGRSTHIGDPDQY